MSNQSFKVKSGLTLTPVDLTTLTNPQAGDLACDINDSNKIKRYDAASSSWTEVGSGAAGDVDTLLVQDFDSASLSSFTQTGLALVTTNQLDGRQSARLIHQPLVGAIQSFKETFSVSPKYRGVNMTASLLLRSSASQGNVTIQFRDETNSVDYPSQQLQTNSQEIASLVTNSTTLVSGFSNSVINSLKVGMSVTGSGIPTGTTIASINSTALTITLSQAATASATVSLRFSDLPRTIQLGFQIPANCSSYSYTISALQEAGLPETYVDDIVLKNYWLGMSNQGQSSTSIEVPVTTDWQDAGVITIGATTTAPTKGATAIDDVLIRRSGTNAEIIYKFQMTAAGASGSGDYLYSLPNGLQFDTSVITPYSGSFTTGLEIAGQAALVGYGHMSNGASSSRGAVSLFAYDSTRFRAVATQAFSAYTIQSSAFYNFSGALAFNFNVNAPISGWTATETQSFITNDLVPAKAVLGNTSLEIPSITGWQGYTPTFQGFGSPTNIEFEWRQVGENVEIRGKFTSGLVSGVEARVSLPAGLTSAATSIIPSLQNSGVWIRSQSATSHGGTTLIEPSVSYFTFTPDLVFSGISTTPLLKANGNQLVNNSETLSLTASVPCAGLSATEEVVVSGTQSALVEESDSYLRITGFTPVVGSTANRIITLISATYNENIGDAIQYLDDAVNGARFIAQKDGLYRFEFSADAHTTAGIGIGFSKNTTSTTTSFIPLPASEKIAVGYDSGANQIVHVFGEAYLNVGDIIRIHTDGPTSNANATWSTFTASYQGKLKQLNVSSDQKITIPTSELRFEGASARGSTATAIVKFDTMAKLRGDAFTVVSNSVDGTYITMKKAGKLDVSANLIGSTTGGVGISRNQTTLTTNVLPASEVLTASNPSAASFGETVAWSGFVAVGDIIRVYAGANPTSNNVNNFNLSFQEQDISVSVTNTLPQFSESDSSVRVDTANGYGSTATRIRRFSNVRDNIGTDIEYVDSATNGASFTVRSSGIYSISYTDQATVATYIGISKNSSELTTSIGLINVINRLAIGTTDNTSGYPETVSWQGYLQAGDIIRAHTDGGASGAPIDRAQFTISKVGKPNVTGVDVTPFVNVPQPDIDSIYLLGSTNSTAIQTDTFTSQVQNDTKGIISYTKDAVAGDRITLLKNAKITVSYTTLVSNSLDRFITVNGVNNAAPTSGSTSVIAYSVGNSATQMRATVSATRTLSAGDIIRFQSNGNGATDGSARVTITAEALSDQILTAPETFSTDTAALRYANASEYTLSTLQNAPVGTYITFTYAANTNTRTQTTTPPSQSPADMNANGIRIWTRAYNQSSAAATDIACYAIQIGKGLKGKSLDLYKSAGKVTAGNLDLFINGTADQQGFYFKDYNENTGILVLDAGFNRLTTITGNTFWFSDTTSQASGYLVINASKNPSILGLGLQTVAARGVNTSGQSIANVGNIVMLYDSAKTYDTNGALNTATGVFTAPESGYYQASWSCLFTGMTSNLGQVITTTLFKNGVAFSEGAYNTMDRAVPIDAGSNGSCGVYLAKGDTVDIRIVNNRAGGATSLITNARYNFFSIHKTSLSTGN